MKRISFILLFSLFSFNCLAQAGNVAKPFSIGGGTYGSTMASDDFSNDIEFSGIALSFAYAFTDQLAFRGTYFNLDEDTQPELESRGFDLNLYIGANLATPGFKAYVGGGVFKDEWSVGSSKESFNGLQLSGGLGYNWESVSLDFVLNIRDASDYEDFINDGSFINADVGVATGSLLVSYRF